MFEPLLMSKPTTSSAISESAREQTPVPQPPSKALRYSPGIWRHGIEPANTTRSAIPRLIAWTLTAMTSSS